MFMSEQVSVINQLFYSLSPVFLLDSRLDWIENMFDL